MHNPEQNLCRNLLNEEEGQGKLLQDKYTLSTADLFPPSCLLNHFYRKLKKVCPAEDTNHISHFPFHTVHVEMQHYEVPKVLRVFFNLSFARCNKISYCREIQNDGLQDQN